MKVQRDRSCRASPETVWKRCLENPATWSQWDEDLTSVTNVSGPCVNGTTMTFVMAKDGQKFNVEISNVIRNLNSNLCISLTRNMISNVIGNLINTS